MPTLLKILARFGSPGAVHVMYEAGLTGYGLQRALVATGYVCEAIAPWLIPKRPGELKAIWVPDESDEAIRDLSRARDDAVNACTQVGRGSPDAQATTKGGDRLFKHPFPENLP